MTEKDKAIIAKAQSMYWWQIDEEHLFEQLESFEARQKLKDIHWHSYRQEERKAGWA